jgi:hypothetical protein
MCVCFVGEREREREREKEREGGRKRENEREKKGAAMPRVKGVERKGSGRGGVSREARG